MQNQEFVAQSGDESSESVIPADHGNTSLQEKSAVVGDGRIPEDAGLVGAIETGEAEREYGSEGQSDAEGLTAIQEQYLAATRRSTEEAPIPDVCGYVVLTENNAVFTPLRPTLTPRRTLRTGSGNGASAQGMEGRSASPEIQNAQEIAFGVAEIMDYIAESRESAAIEEMFHQG